MARKPHELQASTASRVETQDGDKRLTLRVRV